MKKYRLLKDTPRFKAGSIYTGNGDHLFDENNRLSFIISQIINIDEWLQEITEPETYTKQDMINFADQCIQTYKEKKSVKFMYELSVYKPHQPVKEERKWTDKEVIDFTQYFGESPYMLNDAFARWKYKKEN